MRTASKRRFGTRTFSTGSARTPRCSTGERAAGRLGNEEGVRRRANCLRRRFQHRERVSRGAGGSHPGCASSCGPECVACAAAQAESLAQQPDRLALKAQVAGLSPRHGAADNRDTATIGDTRLDHERSTFTHKRAEVVL